MQTVSSDARLSDGSAQQDLWYLPDRRIQTRAAAEHAALIAERTIVHGHRREAGPDDHALFTAMHTCAYLARRRAPGGPAGAAEQELWCRR